MLRWLAGPILLCASMSAQAQTFPKFKGFVVDAAGVLPPDVEADLTAKLDALQKDTKRQLVVATIPDLQGYPIEEYGNGLLRAWGVGLKDVDNGAILMIAPKDRKVRVEVGYGLEPFLTDAFSSQVVNTRMLPPLRTGNYGAAATLGADAIVTQLRASPEEAKARTDAAVKDFDDGRRSRASSDGGVPMGLIFWGVILAVVVLPMLLRGRGGRGRAYRSDGGVMPVVLWSIASEMMNQRGGGGWGGSFGGGDDGGGGGAWGGGGFLGGGGGSGGGGGASGSW